MPKQLDNEQDVQESMDSFDSGPSRLLKIPEGRIPIYILSADYADGYVHWIKTPDNRDIRVVCGGGVEGGGFAPQECLDCQFVVDQYKKAKALEAKGNKDKADKLRKKTNQIRGKYTAEFVIVKGELVVERVKGKKKYIPDFEDAEVGILSLTQKQYQDLINLRGSEQYPFIKSGKDLLNRVIVLDKRKRDGSSYPTIEFIPSKHVSDPPDVEWDEEEFDLDADFELDEELILKTYNALTGKVGEKEDEDLEFEEEGEEEEEPDEVDDDFEDDLPEGFDEVETITSNEKKSKAKTGKKPSSTSKRRRRKR